MTTEEIDKAAKEHAQKAWRAYDSPPTHAIFETSNDFKAGADFVNEYWQEKSALNIADVMFSFLNFVREQKPTMVNHGDKISLFELERLVEKFKNRA